MNETRGACGACTGVQTRRQAIGQMSAAMLAAMAGVALWPGTAAAVPVASTTGTALGAAARVSVCAPAAAGSAASANRTAAGMALRVQGRITSSSSTG